MSDVNRNTVIFDPKDVFGRTLTDRIEVKFVNQKVFSLSQRFGVNIAGAAVGLEGVPARPTGLAQVFITPTKYREKSIFVNVPSSGDSTINETFLLDPDRVSAVFPAFTDIQAKPVFSTLLPALQRSGKTSAAAWNDLADQPKAGLLNIYAKAQNEVLEGTSTLFSFVDRIVDFRPQRIFALMAPRLLDLVRDQRDRFRLVLGTLHEFPNGFTRIEEEGSFKTPEAAGNLQITFAQNAAGELMADIDIDDHQGVLHVFDVLKHKITGRNTHPFNIHQVLVFIQDIDPGYQLV